MGAAAAMRSANEPVCTEEARMDTRRNPPDAAMARCIAACNECNRVCLQQIEHCLGLGGRHSEAEHISMLLTCASVCRTAGELMSIESDWYATLCDLCAQVCDECADACEELGDMEECVRACQDCAEECRAMVDDGQEDDDDEDEDEDDEEVGTAERMN
jgi:hypothetical protein